MPKFKVFDRFLVPPEPKKFEAFICIGGEASRKVVIDADGKEEALSKALDMIAPNRIKHTKESEE